MAKITILRADVSTEELTAIARVALDAQAEPIPAVLVEPPPAPALPEPAEAPEPPPAKPVKPRRGAQSPSAGAGEPPRKKVPPVTVVRQPKPKPKATLDERACDWCDKIFTPRAKNQRFHTPECSKAWHAAHDYKAKKNSAPV